MGRREKQSGDAGKSSKSFLILSSSDDEDAKEGLSLKVVEKALLMRAAKLAPDDAVLGEASGGGGGSSAVAAPSSALEDEVVEVPGGVGGNDVIVGSGAGDLGKKKKVVKRVRKKIKKMEVGEQTVIVAKDEEKEETVKASDIVESVEPTAVEITDNIVFRKLAPDDAVLGETSGGGGGSSGVVALSSSSALEDEVVEVPGGVSGNDVIVGSGAGDLGKKKKVLKRVRKKKIKKMEVGEQTVIVAKDEEKEETVKASDIVESLEPTAVEVTDNIVFRKLLRGPRYFDPPDSSWGKCFNCGEEGHTVANCTAVKRKKPCFVCGSLEHSAKQCSKGQDCFICKKGGHRAKDCPEKHNGGYPSLKICLKCGDSGHDMFSCWNGYYSPDDLKGIQCYICNRFGHLCCSNSVNSNTSPRVISCYKCGQLGHTGLACAKIHGEDTGTWSSSSCYKCGEEGHFARECMSSAKANKRSREFSTPTLRFHREEKDYPEFKSVPLDLGKVRKRKKTRNDEKGIATPQKSKRRGGWIVEDPGDFSHRKSEKGSWRSPVTPTSKGRKLAGLTAGGHISGSQSSKKSSTVLSGSSTSQGWSKGFQHRFSAARFGNSGSEGMQRNYNWW